jgi:hypoxanthine phosphoribosyltransferase
MNIIKIYENPTEEILEEYSKFKLGDSKIIKKYENILRKLILKLIDKKEEYIIYTVVKAPVNKDYKKSPMIIAENISKSLGIPIFYGELHFDYNKKSFYDNNTERKAIVPEIKEISKFINKKVLFIDDSFVTGTSLNANLKLLKEKAKAKDIISLFILDLSKSKYSEEEANTCFFKKYGLSGLKEIIKKRGFLPTTQFIRTFYELSEKDKNNLLSGINNKKINNLQKAVRLYMDKA